MTLLLLIILALMCGFVLGVVCTTWAIEKYYPRTWKIFLLEIAEGKQKRADAAREKEA